MKPSDSATPKSDDKSPSTPTSTDTKIEEILQIRCIACDGSGAYQTNDEGDFDQCQYCYEIRFPFIEQAITALKTLLTSEKNKAVVEELESHRVDAIGGGKGGIVMTYEQVEDRLTKLRTTK